MDPSEEKKRIANEKRMKAVQEWKKSRNQQSNVKAVHQTFVSPVKDLKNKLVLFNSDEEEDNNDLDFKIKPQFEGQSGHRLFEQSSEFSSRFKLDERFKIDDEKPAEIEDENDEKKKNFKILESILGYEVNEKFPERKCALKKRQIVRFDPENENALNMIKTDNQSGERPKKNRKKNDISKEPKEQVPASTERYIEVNTNLKEILKSASSSSFSLTSKFSSNDNFTDKKAEDFLTSFPIVKDVSQNSNTSKIGAKKFNAYQRKINTFESQRKFKFFVLENDDRLKEGVQFFQRPKSMEEISAEWRKNKDNLMELFRRKKKASQRGYVTRANKINRKKAFSKK